MNAMQKQCAFQSDELHTKSVLIVEDDKRLMHCLTLAMEARGFEVMNAESVFNARLGDGCGLDVISALKERQPDATPSSLPATEISPLQSGQSNSVPWTISPNLRTWTILFRSCSRRKA
jgi:hypothetical protein